MSQNPTVVIGVGQAGIDVLLTLDSIVTDEEKKEYYRFIALDTDHESLQDAPTDTTHLALSIDEDFVQQDRSAYPYLTQTMTIPNEGTARQRPIGRYSLDNRGLPGFENTFRKLRKEITDHVTRNLGPNIGSFNIFLVNSLGGGTGSGTFPLLLAMLNEIKEALVQSYEVDVYLSGVGIVPEVAFDVAAGSGDVTSDESTFLPNAYAAMSDLEKLTELTWSNDQTVSIPIYSQMYDPRQNDSPEEIRLDKPPFDDYWLIGVDESANGGSSRGSAGFELHRKNVNAQIARSLQAMGKNSARQSSPVVRGGPGNRRRHYTGGFQQREIRVPHDRIREFVELKDEHSSTRKRLTENIPERLDDLRDERERLQTLKQDIDSASVNEVSSNGTDIQSRIDQQLGGPEIIDKHTDPSEIETLLDEIQEAHGLGGVIIALDVLGKKLHDSRGLSAADESRAETIQEFWKKYDLAAKAESRGSSPRTLDNKADAVRELLKTKLEEYTSILENWNPTLLEKVQDAVPPVVDALESEREKAETELETMRNDLDRLDTVEADWNLVNQLQETLDKYRTEIRYSIDERMTDVENEIKELLDKRGRCEAEVEELMRRIESERERLAQPPVTERLAIMPLIPERLDQLDLDTVDTKLDSLADYLEKDLIDREELKAALNQSLAFFEAFESSLMVRNFTDSDITQTFQDVDETWILFAEKNDDLVELIDTPLKPNTSTSDASWLEYLRDPYCIEFVSFTLRGPISAFTFYQQLEEMAEEGHLDAMAPQYEDYRYAFAYPEWYGRQVRPRQENRITIDRPPEPNLECIDNPGLSEGEFKSFVRRTGLDSFIWQGNMWKDYECEGEFGGWKGDFAHTGLTFRDFQESSPEPSLKGKWLAGKVDWEEMLTAFRENMRDCYGFKVDIE